MALSRPHDVRSRFDPIAARSEARTEMGCLVRRGAAHTRQAGIFALRAFSPTPS